ncbi:hypothetical protein [Kangiella sp. HZ709]|uniref:hypothetical protein n=1 Tax=Kangiella sp. HZ709 TaxID=2666328 RepID=UPI0018A24035|nr:hypothetical protein [Kangiella sp. HZ709]
MINTDKCQICGRKLNVHSDPLSDDCGGDCWGCIGEMEADMDCEQTLEMVIEEYKKGFRPDWIPRPKVKFTHSKNSKFYLDATFLNPLMEPYSNQEIDVQISIWSKHKRVKSVFNDTVFTDKDGKIEQYFELPQSKRNQTPYFEVHYENKYWGFPIIDYD